MVTLVNEIGNSKITVYSPSGVITMTPEERREWFEREFEKGNPVVRQVAEVAIGILRNSEREGA
ncbi:hypothetical protein LSG31_00670 [Fodinisporobacter ferrooxydans]|uniref:Uncharacterized protein n=1 Tax=Fodinisporobacter ferrooxydans TaxID=2901836 RepID=A0ABY4CNL8_9BACL|nr:hypothetical protein LSG31_00670 [Alicyclobacillaceae bacterium MYW30-H2]